MIPFEDYADGFEFARIERRDGIVQLTLHSDGGPLRWGPKPHAELSRVFAAIAQDRDNRVVILTGTGDEFSGPRADPNARAAAGPASAREWDAVYWHGKHLIANLLDIEVPVIAAVNGPARRHAELALLSDIVLAADDACFQDSGHFAGGLVPGDGVNVVFPMLLGLNRARYFLLTGQEIGAAEAQALGLVNEVLARDALLDRAWALAEEINRRPLLMLRYTRVLFTEILKRQMRDMLGYGLALEGLAQLDRVESERR